MTWVVLPEATFSEITKFQLRPNPCEARLRAWWVKMAKTKAAKPIPLAHMVFVPVQAPNLGLLYDKSFHVVQGQTFGNFTPFILYYAIPPGQSSGWQGAIHVLGLALTDKVHETRTIGSLLQTYEYTLEPEAELRWCGAPNDAWFRFCFSLDLPDSKDDQNHRQEHGASLDQIAYRAKLADVFWNNRHDKSFLASNRRGRAIFDTSGPPGDGYQMLCQLHDNDGNGAYFDMMTEEGRARDAITYWMCLLAALQCPKDSFQMQKRDHFERELLRFRLERYFFTDAHFRRLLEHNPGACDDDQVRTADDPGDRERQLFDSRHASLGDWNFGLDSMPSGVGRSKTIRTWISVPEEHAGKAIVGNPLYDIDKGRVIITHYDAFQWIWTRMDLAARKAKTHLWSTRHSRHGPKTNLLKRKDEEFLQVDTLLRVMHEEMKQEDERDRAALEALRLLRLGEGSGGALTLDRVKQTFPPCMGRILKDAFLHHTHPKHKTRVSLVKFLLEAGFAVEAIDKLIYDMYDADRDYVFNEHQGNWDIEAYNTVFKDAVKHLHSSIVVTKRISPYGCAHLTGYKDKEQKNVQTEPPPIGYGCPFSSTIPGQKADMVSARAYLQWAGTPATDIEDILRHSDHPQLCCSAYYLQRFPDNNGMVINHPNQFVRGAVLVETKKKRQKINL